MGTAARTKAWRTRVTRNGRKDRVPVNDLRRMVRQLRAKGWSECRIAAAAGVSQQALWYALHKGHQTAWSTATAVEALWADHCPPRDLSRWPTEPLRDALVRRWGSIKAAPLSPNDRRMVYRSESLDTGRADSICASVDLDPEFVWFDWFAGGVGCRGEEA